MPWSVKKMNDKFCVVKEGETSAIKGGCHADKAEAAAHVRALYAAEAEHAVSEIYGEIETEEDFEEFGHEGDSFEFSDTMKEFPWTGPIVFENVFTGDNRVFKADSINWQEETLPWAFRWQKHSGQGHIGSVPIGRVDRLERMEDGSIVGFGVIIPELSEEAAEYYKILKSGVGGGVSVDGDSAQFEIQEQEGSQPKVEFSAMRLRALSAVDIPAFNGARIHLIEDEADAPETTPLQVDGQEITDLTEELGILESAKKGVKKFIEVVNPFDDKPKKKKKSSKKSSLSYDGDVEEDDDDEELDLEELADEKPFPFEKKDKEDPDEDEEDSEEDDSEEEEDAEKKDKDEEVKDDEEDTLTFVRQELAKKKRKKKAMSYGWSIDESLTAAAIPTIPSTEAFVDPSFDGPTPLTVTPDGRVFGHLALFNTCHIGFPGTCVKPPKGSKYQYFHTGQLETAEGDLVEVGRLTFKTGHAEMQANPRVAAEHYDNTGAVAADVRAGEDKFGIWVAGALRPHLTDEDIREFRCAPLSGDWRRIAGRLELVGALSVNIPGFPVPRVRALVASGETETLITFLEDSDEEFIISDYEMDLRLNKRLELASKVSKFFGEEIVDVVPEGAIKEEVPAAPSKKELEARAENYTKNQFFADLKALRELLDDKDEKMTKKVRAGLEELYAAAIRTDSDGKRFSYDGYDLDIVENSGLDIEEWEVQLELSGLDIQEFYNQCHDENGKFCPGSDGPGRLRDNVSGKHPIEGNPHLPGQGGREAGDTSHRHSAPYERTNNNNQPRNPQATNQPQNNNPQNNPQQQGGGVNHQLYENHLVTRRRARGWAAAATIAALALNSPASPFLAGLATAGGVGILANPAVLSLLFVTGVGYAARNTVASRRHRAEYNRQVQRRLARERLNQRQQRERERLNVST